MDPFQTALALTLSVSSVLCKIRLECKSKLESNKEGYLFGQKKTLKKVYRKTKHFSLKRIVTLYFSINF